MIGSVFGLLANKSDRFYMWPLACKGKLTPVISAMKDYNPVMQTENPLIRRNVSNSIEITKSKIKTVEAVLGDIFAFSSSASHEQASSGQVLNTTTTHPLGSSVEAGHMSDQVSASLSGDQTLSSLDKEKDLDTTSEDFSVDAIGGGKTNGDLNEPRLIIEDSDDLGPAESVEADGRPEEMVEDHPVTGTNEDVVVEEGQPKPNRKTRRALAKLKRTIEVVEKQKAKVQVRVPSDVQIREENSVPKKKALVRKRRRHLEATKRNARKAKQVTFEDILEKATRYEDDDPLVNKDPPSHKVCSLDGRAKQRKELVAFLTEETDFTADEIEEVVAQSTIMAIPNPDKVIDEIVFDGPEDKAREAFIYWDLDEDKRGLIDNIVNKFPHVILEKDAKFLCGQAPFEFDIELIEGGEEKLSKIKKKVYPLKGPQRQLLKDAIPVMEQTGHGTSTPVPGDVLYANPVFYAKKARCSKLRMCIDTTELNKVTKDIDFPIPVIDEVIAALKGKKFFTVIDLKQGFNQFPLSARARRYMNMATQEGIFQFKSLPFGPKNGPKFFQHCMSQIFREVLGVFVHIYIDDIIIFSDSFEEHIEHLNKVFEILANNKLVAQIDKCFFCLKQLKYLGKVVSGEGVQTDPDTVSYMVNYPTPKNVKQVRSFIGLCSHYRNFVTGFSLIAEPLIRLTRSNQPWVWEKSQQKSFDLLKDRMVQSPVLAHPDWSKPFYLQTDASKYGAGAVLAQKDGNDKFHPIAYSSWLFDNAQRNYSTTERELLAIVLATRKWMTYLHGTQVFVETDHKPLAGKWDWKDPYGKVTRWADELRRYNLTITYVKGKDNEHADALSRNFMEEVFAGLSWELVDQTADQELEVILSMTTEELVNKNYFKPAYVLAKEPVTDLFESILSLSEQAIPADEDWAKAQRQDDWYKQMIRWIEAGELPKNNAKAKWVLGNSAQFSLDPYTGVLMKSGPNNNPFQLRRCVPKSWRKLIVSICHDSKWVGAHMGRDKTIHRVAEKFYFPKMKEYIEAYTAICPACQCSKHRRGKPKVPLGTIESSGVWDLVCIDLWKAGVTSNKGNKYVLTVVDAFSKFAIPIAIPSKKEEVIARALLDVISDKGPMKRLHSDQGREFCNKVLDELCKLLEIGKSRTTAYHPQGNGLAERIHQFYRSAITSFVNSSGTNWDEHLLPLKLAFRSTACAVPAAARRCGWHAGCRGAIPTAVPGARSGGPRTDRGRAATPARWPAPTGCQRRCPPRPAAARRPRCSGGRRPAVARGSGAPAARLPWPAPPAV